MRRSFPTSVVPVHCCFKCEFLLIYLKSAYRFLTLSKTRKYIRTSASNGSFSFPSLALPAAAHPDKRAQLPYRSTPLCPLSFPPSAHEKGMLQKHPSVIRAVSSTLSPRAGHSPQRYRPRLHRCARPFLRNPKRCCSPSSSLRVQPHPDRSSPCRLPSRGCP